MRAVVQETYGPPDEVLTIRDVDRPSVGDDEVLVRVRAASMHPDVWHAVTGRPYVMRLMFGVLLRPKHPIPGTDIAGVVVSVGKCVTDFQKGDEVFGETFRELTWRNGGAYAEYVSVPRDTLALKPGNVSFEQAACVPNSGYIALLNLQNGELIKPGHHMLVNGAGGGVGSLAVQLAKAIGAEVTGVDSGEKLEMIRSLGADHAIDYTKEDCTRSDERYDLIFDVASTLTLRACKRVLKPTGLYIMIGHDHFGKAVGPVFGSLPRFFRLMAIKRFEKHLPNTGFETLSKQVAMDRLKELVAQGKITPIVARTFALDQVPEAMRCLAEGRVLGRIVITP